MKNLPFTTKESIFKFLHGINVYIKIQAPYINERVASFVRAWIEGVKLY